jgi:hypothetical protein
MRNGWTYNVERVAHEGTRTTASSGPVEAKSQIRAHLLIFLGSSASPRLRASAVKLVLGFLRAVSVPPW